MSEYTVHQSIGPTGSGRGPRGLDATTARETCRPSDADQDGGEDQQIAHQGRPDGDGREQAKHAHGRKPAEDHDGMTGDQGDRGHHQDRAYDLEGPTHGGGNVGPAVKPAVLPDLGALSQDLFLARPLP